MENQRLHIQEDYILSFQKGEQKGFTHCFNQFYAPLCCFASRLVNIQQIAEDIVEESFIKLCARHADFSHVKSIKSFLYLTTRNACLNYLKQSKVMVKQEKAYCVFAETVEGYVLNEMIRAEVMREIYEAIEALPAQCSKIFHLSYVEGMKNEEIACQLRLSVNTVKNQKVKALKLLKQQLLNNTLLLICLYQFLPLAGIGIADACMA